MGSRGLVLAALVARILTCAPMAEAIRDVTPDCPWGHERINGNCAGVCSTPLPLACYAWLHPEFLHAYPCTVKVCGLHASCVKDVGQPAMCVCDGGFAMTPDQGCVDTCTLKACVDGTCSKLENGTAVCSCDAEAGFKLQLDKRTCKDTCVVKDCVGGGGTCTQDADGVAFCHCDAVAGLKLQDDGRTCKASNFGLSTLPHLSPTRLSDVCVIADYTCVVKDCVGGGGTCTHEVNGTATCHCDAEAGLKLQDDGRTCKDVCVIEACEVKDANSECKRVRDVAHCECKTNFELFEGVCTDTCVVKDCVGGGGTCTHEVNGTATCHCDAEAGLKLQDDGRTCKDVCVIEACEVKDANSECKRVRDVAHCECKTNFELFEGVCTDTCVVKDCVGGGGTCTHEVNGTATCHCDGDAGLVLLDDKRTCKDTCVVKGCGVNGKCQKEITTGVASCVCDLGFTLQADGTTCKDNCEILSCSGPKEHCAKSATTGEAYCKCDDYFHRAAGGFCQDKVPSA
ncbi:unnamed protein product [Closterium sp. NIES-64]|nr:unnamed protein product [Closterium sp. NIES-64]